jgi:hypothetical protein
MSNINAPAEGETIKFGDKSDISQSIEPQLKYLYGPGIYTHDISETPSGDLIIHIGNEFLKDLSDCREKDNVIKFVPIDDIYQLKAEKTNATYAIDLPDRDVIIDNYYGRKQEIVDYVDMSMARMIYSNISYFGDVANQLTPIRQILHWARTRENLHVHDVHSNQRSNQTSEVLSVLQDLDYIHIDKDGIIHQEEMLDSLDLSEVAEEDFNEVVLGDVIQRGYRELVERLDLNILTHYPRISGAYYIDSLQKTDPGLWLDMNAIVENMNEYFNSRFKTLYVEEKLAQLSHIGIIEKEGDFVKANGDVYQSLEHSMNTA